MLGKLWGSVQLNSTLLMEWLPLSRGLEVCVSSTFRPNRDWSGLAAPYWLRDVREVFFLANKYDIIRPGKTPA